MQMGCFAAKTGCRLLCGLAADAIIFQNAAAVLGTLLPLCKLYIIPDTTYRLHLYYSTCKREIKGKNKN